jgi:hypothetical protein
MSTFFEYTRNLQRDPLSNLHLHRIFCLKAFEPAVIPVGSHPGTAVFYCEGFVDAARRAENLRMGGNPEKTGVDIDTRLKPLPVNG